MKTTTDSPDPQSLGASSSDAAIESALKSAHDAVTPKRRRVWPWVLFTQLAVLLIGYLTIPYFTTHLIFDREAREAEDAAVIERSRVFREREDTERARREIHEEHADPIKRKAREKRRRDVLAHVSELEAIAKRMREKRNEQLTKLTEAPAQPSSEEAQTRLVEAIEKFSKASGTIKANENIEDQKPYNKAVEELLAQAEATRKKSNEPTGLDVRGRESMSERLTEAETALQTLQGSNPDPSSGDLSSELGDAQEMLNLLRPVPNQLQKTQQQKKSAETRLKQQRDRSLDEMKREVDRIKQSHRGLLAQKERSSGVQKLAAALDAMQKTIQQQKSENRWDQSALDKSFDQVKAAAEGAKELVQKVHDLGDQRETQGLAGLLNNQQRQTDGQRKQWQQLQKKHTGEAKKSDQAVAAALDKAKAQWAKTRDKLAPSDRAANEQAVGELLKKASSQTQTPSAGSPPSKQAEVFKAEAEKLAGAVKQTAGADQQAQKEAGEFQQALQHLASEVGKHEQVSRKHAEEHGSVSKRIQGEWQKAQQKLNDKGMRVAPSLAVEQDGKPAAKASDASLTKVAEGLQQLNTRTSEINNSGKATVPDMSAAMTARSQGLADLLQSTQKLNQTQKTMQKGIAKDESARLDLSLANLARNLGRKGDDVQRQTASHAQASKRMEAGLQESLDRIKEATAKNGSTDAKSIAKTLTPTAPDNAAHLLSDPAAAKSFTDRMSKAQAQAGKWLSKASGEAPPRQQQMAEARQKLRELSEAMAEAGLSKQNADAAADLLDQPLSDTSALDLSDLDGAVAAAETMHKSIESDFQSIRAAEIASRTGQSFEHMRRLANERASRKSTINIPDAGTKIDTVGDLKAYRKAMDTAVGQTEGLTQNARTLQRQALGEDDPSLARALSKARAAVHGKKARSQDVVRTGSDPRGSDHRSNSKTRHQMTFEKTPVRSKRLDAAIIKAEALPGRRFTSQSARQGWLYVDTWYVIGPWENHGKIDWSNIHSPEFEIDLAKTYPGGKGGRQLRWQFTQNPTIRCDVPDEKTNSSYYAYTEVYFDEPREMLVAIASNDAGKLWINGKVIWQDEGLSIWNMDEGFRRVRFKKGFSKVLMRIENGPRFCQYSLLLCPPENQK